MSGRMVAGVPVEKTLPDGTGKCGVVDTDALDLVLACRTEKRMNDLLGKWSWALTPSDAVLTRDEQTEAMRDIRKVSQGIAGMLSDGGEMMEVRLSSPYVIDEVRGLIRESEAEDVTISDDGTVSTDSPDAILDTLSFGTKTVKDDDGVERKVAGSILPALASVMSAVRVIGCYKRCRVCGDPIASIRGSGRKKNYCSEACRQKYMKTRLCRELMRDGGLPEAVAAKAVGLSLKTETDVYERNRDTLP